MSTLPQILSTAVKHHPNHTAFKCNNLSFSYQELWASSNKLARHISEAGVQREDRVGIFMNRSIETAVAIFGIMQAGAAYVPLDPESHAQRNAFIINDCGLKVVLTNESQRRRFSKVLEQEVNLDLVIGATFEEVKSTTWEHLIQETDSEEYQVEINENDLAYILYTSGSTGTPKGIMHTHASGFAYAQLSVGYYRINSKDIIGNHAAINFDISTLGYFAGPLAGATTVIVPDAHIKMPGSLVKLISHEQISVWYSVPSALVKLLDQDGLRSMNFNNLRWVLFAGEPFPTPSLKALMKKWAHARFSNIFGPTEVNGCTYLVLDEIPESDDPISIGKPWDRTEVLIVGDEDKLVDTGDVGELLVCTPTMMKGYWNDSDKTRDSFYVEEGKTYYRTGDLVKENADGNLIFLGRKDRQIKLRGYRIELDEIDSVLWKHSDVKEASAFLTEEHGEEPKIVAAIVAKNSKEIDDIKGYCSKSLAVYAVPEKYNYLDQLPRNARGKVDYSSLLKFSIR